MRYNRFLGFLLFLMPSGLSAQVTITGQCNRKFDGWARLFDIHEGQLRELAGCRSNNGTFGFLFYPEKEGFYVIGTTDQKRQADKYTFYFKKNDQLNITITDTSYVLSGKNSPENQEMEKWHNLVVGIERQSLYYRAVKGNYTTFVPLFEEVLVKSKNYKVGKTGNKLFEEKFEKLREMDLLYYAADMLYIPKSVRIQDADLISYYKDLDPARFTSDTRLMEYPAGQTLLYEMLFAFNWGKRGLSGAFQFDKLLPEIPNDTIKGELAVYILSTTPDFTSFLDKEARLSKYLVSASQKERVKQLKYKIAGNTTNRGEPAANFTAEDTNGKMVSLSDLKGKVVLIDFWATWCGPCVQEIPHLKNLEAYFEGKNVAFVSVSLDAIKDKDKWKQFVKSEGLGGLQLFAGQTGEEMGKLYNIKSIPRFVVIDKNGKLVSSSAPRPSKDKDLRNLLNSELAK